MSVFGQVWIWSLAAFILGALLTWLLLVRPARARVRELERRVVAHRAEPVAMPADYAAQPDPAAQPDYAAQADDFVPSNGAMPSNGVPVAEPEPPVRDEPPVPDRGSPDYAATELFEPANSERTTYMPPAGGRTRVDFAPDQGSTADSDIAGGLNPSVPAHAEPEYAEPEYTGPDYAGPDYAGPDYAGPDYAGPDYAGPDYAESDASRGLFQPAMPSATPQYEPDSEPPETLLPKRQRRESPLGGFDPPEPIQPSMRAVTRREPMQEVHSGSLFEPDAPAGSDTERTSAHDTAAKPTTGAPVGPFGPDSAMPLTGGGKPSEDFTVKASVTTLRYCPPESERFAEMVAEVWFRSPQDAERVGFRPIG